MSSGVRRFGDSKKTRVPSAEAAPYGAMLFELPVPSAPTDTFAVEGNLAPLTFATIADNARLYDANGDSVYTGTVPFSMMKDRTTGKAEDDLSWKL